MTNDIFGIKMLQPTLTGGRTFFAPTNLPSTRTAAVNRIGTTEMVVRGIGGVTPVNGGADYYKIDGSDPRLYIYDIDRANTWDNVEMTCYYNKASASTASYAGMVLGVRSIHELGGSYARTYYVKHHFTNKRIYIMKEQFHPNYVDTYSDDLLQHELNDNTWYGLKFIVRTKCDGSAFFQAYRDLTDGVDGGTWTQVAFGYPNYLDTGTLNGHPPIPSGTSCMIRTDGVTDFRVKKFSIRTIAPICS